MKRIYWQEVTEYQRDVPDDFELEKMGNLEFWASVEELPGEHEQTAYWLGERGYTKAND